MNMTQTIKTQRASTFTAVRKLGLAALPAFRIASAAVRPMWQSLRLSSEVRSRPNPEPVSWGRE